MCAPISPGGAPLALVGAAELLRLPDDDLERLPQSRAQELRLEPGELVLDGESIAGFEADSSCVRVDASGCAVVPGFVDCHTHLPFAGWRAGEYAQKIAGTSYTEIAYEGGGIRASARALANASDAQVLAQSRALADEMLRHGTTTFECKSGYGLSVEGELRALGLAGELLDLVPQGGSVTALLAHAVPDGYSASDWMDAVEGMLDAVRAQTRAGALDIFVESIAFSNDDLLRMGRLARRHGLALRAHVEQLSSYGSARVAIAAGARSVDHLSCMPLDDIPALADAECAAVLLPGAEFIGAERTAPGRELADGGAVCALATDLNPGTSPIVSLPLIAGLAVRRYEWSVKEALLALTLNAAWVLGVSSQCGALSVGRRADVLLLDSAVNHIPYRFGHNPVAAVFVAGRPVWVRDDHAWRFEGLAGTAAATPRAKTVRTEGHNCE
ncbi:MAG: imidazolonepropionase [Acidobacteriota bacterium]|nr:imidazolonepropionase [Acidobacteriota bacterium]